MKYLIAVATVAVALVLMAAPAQAQYCHNIVVGPFADNVLTPNEKSRHRFDSVTGGRTSPAYATAPDFSSRVPVRFRWDSRHLARSPQD